VADLTPLLQKKVDALRQGADYKRLLETVVQATRSMDLGAIADEVVRPIARDLSAISPDRKVVVQMFIMNKT